MWNDERNNKLNRLLVEAKKRGKEVSIYEGLNYHTTFGDKDAPVDQINRIMAGYAGGVSATHTGLILLKHWGARTQQNFNLSQYQFKPGGAFGNPAARPGRGGSTRTASRRPTSTTGRPMARRSPSRKGKFPSKTATSFNCRPEP